MGVRLQSETKWVRSVTEFTKFNENVKCDGRKSYYM